MLAPNVLDAQKALAPSKVRVRIPKLLRILVLEVKIQYDDCDAPNYRSSNRKTISPVIVRGVAVDLCTDDGETLADCTNQA